VTFASPEDSDEAVDSHGQKGVDMVSDAKSIIGDPPIFEA